MADASSTWRGGASSSANTNAGTGGSGSGSGSSNWGRGNSTASSSPAASAQGSKKKGGASRSRGGGAAKASKETNTAASTPATTTQSNFKSGAPAKPTKFLPTQPLPYHSLQNIKDYYHGLLDSGLVKKAWLDNPKNPIQNYVLHRTGTYPVYTVEEGQVEGRRDTNFRCTLHFDPEYDWHVYGDAKTAKDAERLAALHAVLFLQNNGDILTKTPTASAPAPLVPQQQGPVAKLSDGSELTVQRAREFIDFYCKRFNLGKPDIRQSAGKQGKPKRGAKASSSSSTTQQPHASMYIAGNEIGAAVGKNKKQAVANCYLESVAYIESTDPSLWKTFSLLHKPGMSINKAPHVTFSMSEELDDSVQNIYDTMIRSKIYAKRPRTIGVAPAGEDPNAASSDANDQLAKQRQMRQQRARRFNQQFGATEDSLQRKSEQLELSLANYYSDDAMANMRNQRLSLPVSQKQSDVLVKVELNQVTICMAATGSGKTTQIPQILFDDYILQGKGAKCNIICTQPRRIAAISVAERVAKERGEKLGQTVGYQVRFEAKPPQPNGSITFCTTGVFLRRLQSALGDAESSNTFLDSITHVVIDEVHERDVETDLLLVVIKRLLAERRRLGKNEIKVVLMSATIDPTLFQSYFAGPSGIPAPVVEIPGRSFPVEKHYLEETVRNLEALRLAPQMGGWVWGEKNVRDYIEREIYQRGGSVSRNNNAKGGYGQQAIAAAGANEPMDPMADQVDDLEIPYPLVALIIAYVLSISDDGHVLVFLPGWDEIKAVNLLLTDTQYHPLLRTDFNDRDQFEIHILHSTVPVQDQQAVFEPVRHKGIRRIILATNIAETSITIPDVVYVVDTGRVKEKRFDPERHLSSLVSAWVGTSNLNQRAGRAGRHRAGEYFGVLSKARYDRLKVNQTVEMKRTDLSNVVMHIKALDIPGMEVEEVLASAIEPPAPERVLAAIEKLKMVGALDMYKNLTSLGRVLLQLPVDAPMGKMCLYGAFFRCLDPVLSLAAILTSRDPFMAPMHLREEAEMIKDRWCPPDFRSDALCILRAYTRWWEMQSRGDFAAANRFCQDNFLSKLTLLQIQQVKEHLFQSMEKADIISVIQSSSLSSNAGGNHYSRYRRPRETDAEFNTNAESTSLLAALVAVSSPPNFAIRSGKASYRTSQDKSCLMHPSSICHTKFTKHKPWDAANMGEKEIFAFSEKIRNASGSAGNNASTMLRGCTRLDPLTFMLFGATEVRVLGEGVECDYWLPITGNTDSLDNLEKLRSIMDVIMLRVFEGIGKRKDAQQHKRDDRRGDEDEDEVGDDDGDDEEWGDRTDLCLSAQEIGEFEYMSQGVVHILDGYAQERGWASSSRGSTRPGSPASFGIGGLSLQEPSRAAAPSSGVYGAGGSRGGSSTNLFAGEGVGLASMPSSVPTSTGGSRWTSRSHTPDPHAATPALSIAASTTTNATAASNTTRTTKASTSTAATRTSAGNNGEATADGGKGGKGDGAKGNWRARSGGRGGRGGGGGGRGGRGGRQGGNNNPPPAAPSS